mgnify:CR=1 FL=1
MFQSKQEILEEKKKELQETNQEATNRIAEELRTERKLAERRDSVMNMFFEITEMPMPLAWFEEYDRLFSKAKKGYNIKSFIATKTEDIKKYKDFMKQCPTQ